MRTSVSLQPHLAARLAELQAERGWSLDQAANRALRRGLDALEGEPVPLAPREPKPYRMPVRDLGFAPSLDVDRIRHTFLD